MQPLVKICGIRDAQSAETAARSGADMLGFIDYPASPRHLTLEAATALGPELPDGPYRAGVFVNRNIAEIRPYADALGLTHAQLHGREGPDFVRKVQQELGLTVIKAVGVDTAADVARARQTFDGIAEVLLFDAKPPPAAPLPGGNALTFPWHLLKPEKFYSVVLLAGGLRSYNTQEALAASGADGLDVSSGVEDAPGIKSQSKIEAFIKAAKSAKQPV